MNADYVAGLIDGEGSLGITKTQYKNRPSPTYRAFLTITNTNKKVLVKVAQWLDSTGANVHIIPKKKGNDGHTRQDCYVLMVNHNGLKKILSLIKGKLIIRSRQAKVLTRFLSTLGLNNTNTLPRFILQYREDLKQYCSWLNHNG